MGERIFGLELEATSGLLPGLGKLVQHTIGARAIEQRFAGFRFEFGQLLHRFEGLFVGPALVAGVEPAAQSLPVRRVLFQDRLVGLLSFGVAASHQQCACNLHLEGCARRVRFAQRGVGGERCIVVLLFQ